MTWRYVSAVQTLPTSSPGFITSLRTAMMAPCSGGCGRRKRGQLAIGGAVVFLLLLYFLFSPATQDLTDVFYPPVTTGGLSQLHDWSDPAGSTTNTDDNGAAFTQTESSWIPAPPPPAIPPDSTIFLLETSGRADISPREWCAVESAARAHPHHTVLFLVSSPRLRRSPLASSVLALNNTRLARLRFAEVFSGTVLAGWYRSRVVLRSWWQASHMSDALRFALLVKFGGMYLDTDVIVRRSMAEMEDGAGLESEHSLAAGVLKFSRNSPIPGQLAGWFVDHYNPHDWGANGPDVVTAVLLRECGLGALPLPPSHCGQYTIFGRRRFYGVPWPDWQLLLEPSQRDAILERVDASYVVHTWALHSGGHPAPPGSALQHLARQHCPRAFTHARQPF